MTDNKKKKNPRKFPIFLIPLILVLAGGGYAYTYWTQQKAQAATTSQQSSYQTTTVRSGSLSISASGSGTLIAGKETQLSFSASGKVANVHVKVGDQVSEGQVLAELESDSSLTVNLSSAQLNLDSAKQALQDLQDNAQANLANEELAVADAQRAADDAESALVEAGEPRCSQDTINAYYVAYMREKDNLDTLKNAGNGTDYYLNTIVPAENSTARAYATWEYCNRYTQYEIDSSHANLTLAQANLEEAKNTLVLLQANGGIDPIVFAQAENNVANSQIAYDQAQQKLQGTTLVAPFDGTIFSVAGEAGDEVGTSPFITIADLLHPQVEFSVDETDIDKVAIGYTAQVVFDSFPDDLFNGTVVTINPALVSSGGYQVLQGWIQLDLSTIDNPPSLMEGMNASVEIIAASAENVLLVPVEAMRDLGDGQYAVFVVGSDGQPRLTVVEVGLEDATYAEIKSGLSLGDVVTTGITETK
jgi:HlyD family secretion protein